jgi:exopolyphosphatase/guanosine-5'-triphosphate,3'-diphosphate pyrophosphatase
MPEPRHIEFQALPDEDKAAILLLIPLLRLADAFDRSKEQKISSLECRVNPHSVQLLFAGKGRTDLEQWAAGQSAEIFRSVYGRTLQIERIKR